jgi:hypothetical protein
MVIGINGNNNPIRRLITPFFTQGTGKSTETEKPVDMTATNATPTTEVTRQDLDNISPYAGLGVSFSYNKPVEEDPVGFVEAHLSPEQIASATNTATEVWANMEVNTTLSNTRQDEVVAGFSQRNESPNAFTGEFLDLFVA